MKIIKIIGILAAVTIIAVAIAGMYKFNYLSGKSGYDVDGNKIKVGLANPASEFCIEQGGTLEIKDEENGQTGYCTMPDGSVFEEWEFYRSMNGEGKGTATTEIFKVGPQKESCMGAFPQECLIVNGEFFYDTIEGFDFKKGYTYEIEVERNQFCDPNILNDCRQDVGIYNYKLIKVLKKEAWSDFEKNTEVIDTEDSDFIKNCEKENGVILGPNKSLQCAKNGKISFADGRKSIDIASCENYNDGCNSCFVNNGEIGGCTLMYCEEEIQKPGCMK